MASFIIFCFMSWNHFSSAFSHLFCTFLYTVPHPGRTLPLTLKCHSHTISFVHSFPVFLTFCCIKALLQFSHYVLISNLAFNVSYTSSFRNIKLCHNFTPNSSFSLASIPFTFVFRSSTAHWRPLLTLNEKSKNLWIFYHKWHGCPSANKSNSAVWVGTWKHLRNAIVRAVKEWGLDSPIAFVPVATTHTGKTFSEGAFSSLSVRPHISRMVLHTVPLTDLFHTPTIVAIRPNPPPHFF